MRQVNLVDDTDKIIGQTDLLDAHRGDGKKHQAISLFLFHLKENGSFEFLLQQRSKEKIVGAFKWANSLCANLIPEENHLQCLKRRVLEELGVKWQVNWFLREIAAFDYRVACENGFCENEIDHFFVSILNTKSFSEFRLDLNPKEVADTIWLDWNLLKTKKIGDKILTPWTNLFLDNHKIIGQIDEVLQIWQKKNQ